MRECVHGMVAEEFFLCDSAVDIKQKGVLVEGNLWWYSNHHVFFEERLAVHLVIGQSPFYSTAHHILELL